MVAFGLETIKLCGRAWQMRSIKLVHRWQNSSHVCFGGKGRQGSCRQESTFRPVVAVYIYMVTAPALRHAHLENRTDDGNGMLIVALSSWKLEISTWH